MDENKKKKEYAGLFAGITQRVHWWINLVPATIWGLTELKIKKK